jgi:hypothetical protein
MCESHAAGSNDHKDAKHAFDRVEMLAFFRFRIGLDTPNRDRSDDGNGDRYRGCEDIALCQVDIEPYMLKALAKNM